MNKKINIFQLRAVLITSIIGVGVVSLPGNIAEMMSTTSWFGLLLGGTIYILFTLIILKLLSSFPNDDLYGISKAIIGRFLAIIVIIVFIIYFSLVTSITARYTSIAVEIWMLPRTPLVALLISFFIISGYLASKGIEGVSRFVTVFLLYNLSSIFMVIFLVLPKITLYNIKPFFHTNVSTVIEGTKSSLLSFLGIETLFIFHKYVDVKTNVKKVVIKSLIFIIILYILLVEITIGYFGIDQLKIFSFPVITLFKTIKVKLLMFERVELFFLTLWISAAFTTISIYFFSGCYLIKKLFPEIKVNYIIIVYIILVFVTSLYPTNIQNTSKYLNLVGSIGGILITVIPTLLLIIGKLRRVIK